MASAAHIDDSGSEVIDPPKSDILDVAELVGDHIQLTLKPNVVASSRVRELLECPVCLSAMYPPIHQVCICAAPSHSFSLCCVLLSAMEQILCCTTCICSVPLLKCYFLCLLKKQVDQIVQPTHSFTVL